MAEHIEVVDINNDNNEEKTDVCLENLEVEHEVPTEKKHSFFSSNVKIPESFILEADFNEIADKALEEDTTPPGQPAQGNLIIDTPAPVVSNQKPKSKARQESSALKDKTTCPDCEKQITMHALKYTHKRYCKATTKSAEAKETITPDIEDKPSVRNICPLPEPLLIPTSEQIAAFLAQDRKMKAEKKRSRMNNLISHAF
jgi:hypothetical protein